MPKSIIDLQREQLKQQENETESDALSKVTPASLLEQVATQINTDFYSYKGHEKEATTLMLKIGLMVEFIKEQLPHGQLQKWMQENTELSYRHAHRFHKLAKIFIEVRQLKAGEAFALVDPANSEAALTDRLQQMAFEFLGDKTQAELLAEHGIAVKQAKALGGNTVDPNAVPATPEQLAALERQTADEFIRELILNIDKLCLGEKRKVHLVEFPVLKALEEHLMDSLKNVRDLINAG